MTTAIKRRRGTTAQHSTFTGLEGEITVDTTKDTLVVHDGSTAGGFALLREDLSNNTNVVTLAGTQTLSNKTFSTNPAISSGTANGVAYLNGSKVLTTGSALTFDGTALGIDSISNNQISLNCQSGSTGTRITFSRAGVAKTYFGDANSITGANLDATALFTTGTNPLIFGIGSEQMRLTSTGLGIGTSTPSYKLDIVQSGGSNVGVSASDGTRRVLLTASRGSTGEAAIGTTNNYGFAFETNSTQRMYLDTSGNLGLGVTPSASTITTLQVKQGAIANGANNNIFLLSNAFNGAGGWTYIGSDTASMYQQAAGQHRFYTAPSGTAGNPITFTQAMTLDASGRLGIGTTSPSTKLEVAGDIKITSNANLTVIRNSEWLTSTAYSVGGAQYQSWRNSAGTRRGYFGYGSSNDPNLGLANEEAGAIFMSTNGTERMRIDSSGNVGIGTSSPVAIGAGYTSVTVNGSNSGRFDVQYNGTHYGTYLAD